MNDKKFLIIGRTASGKTSITNAVCDLLGLKLVKSFTTRLPRNEEERLNSRDHIFVTDKEFDDIYYGQEIIAYTKIGDTRYCATKEELTKCSVYIIDPDGIKVLFDSYSDEFDFTKIYIKCPKKIMEKHAIERGQTKEQFDERYDKENEQFTEFEKSGDFDYHLLNDGTLEDAVEKMVRIITKELTKEKE